MIDKIFPVFCGEYNSKKKAFEDFFGTGGLPAAPAVAVGSVERGDAIDPISFPFYSYQILLFSTLSFSFFCFLYSPCSCSVCFTFDIFSVLSRHPLLVSSLSHFTFPPPCFFLDLKLMMDLQCLGTPLVPDRTVSSVLSAITACHGAKIDGDGEVAFK